MSDKPKVLLVGDLQDPATPFAGTLSERCDVVEVDDPQRALASLALENYAGVFVASPRLCDASRISRLLQSERMLEQIPDGVALLDADNNVVWSNAQFREWCGESNGAGTNFYTALGSPEILGPDYCPFHTAKNAGASSNTTLRTETGRYFHVHAAGLTEQGPAGSLIVTVRDITKEMLQQQKLAAIHRAGIELTDMTPAELALLTVDERIELLKGNILHYTKDLLHFDVVEIRLLDQKAGQLIPLLSVGFKPEAAMRELYARPQNNGVTGFVASTGKSYLCEDTSEDPLYLEGCQGAKSSLTVPLVFHEQVIGTFNVESAEARAFSESDMQFLEVFCRDLAAALNTLELLQTEHHLVAKESVEAIHRAVALPVDDILNDAVSVMEQYIGHEPEVVDRLQRILRHARDIKQVIHRVGQQLAPGQARPTGAPEDTPSRPALLGRRILVADSDNSVREAAHTLLEKCGCVVEGVRTGAELIYMVRNAATDAAYDVLIADIRLADMSGHQLYCKLKELSDAVPLILMTGYGYDPGHTIVKCRQAGLKEYLFKPFRLDQLLDTVERAVSAEGPMAPA
ncbi:MAG: response regulator [Pirellulales bacterium]